MDFPTYSWKQNRGYPTVQDRSTVIAIGLSPFHRKIFNVSDPQLSLTFEGAV